MNHLPTVVIYPDSKSDIFTQFQEYKTFNTEFSQGYKSTFNIINDFNIENFCLEEKCSHLRGSDGWIIKSREGKPDYSDYQPFTEKCIVEIGTKVIKVGNHDMFVRKGSIGVIINDTISPNSQYVILVRWDSMGGMQYYQPKCDLAPLNI